MFCVWEVEREIVCVRVCVCVYGACVCVREREREIERKRESVCLCSCACVKGWVSSRRVKKLHATGRERERVECISHTSMEGGGETCHTADVSCHTSDHTLRGSHSGRVLFLFKLNMFSVCFCAVWCGAVCCSVLQCVAVCCSVLQRVAV